MQSFYQETFRMQAVEEAARYCVLESDVLTLSLILIPEHIATGIVLTDPPTRRESVPVKLTFPVDNIDDLRPVVTWLGGVVDPPEDRWEFRGQVRCDGVDPEGNIIQFLQPIPQITSPPDHEKVV